jgi:hypothetical protein
VVEIMAVGTLVEEILVGPVSKMDKKHPTPHPAVAKTAATRGSAAPEEPAAENKPTPGPSAPVPASADPDSHASTPTTPKISAVDKTTLSSCSA